MAGKNKLTAKQEMFCKEYLKDLNATQAAIRAGYSKKHPDNIAAQLMSKTHVSSKIQHLMDKRASKMEIQSEKVLGELKTLGHSDIRLLFDDNGAVKPISQWPDEIAKAVEAIQVVEEFEYHAGGFYCDSCGRKQSKELIGQTKKVKLWDKPKALELMGKHKKLFTEKTEVSNPDGSMKPEPSVVVYLPEKDEP